MAFPPCSIGALAAVVMIAAGAFAHQTPAAPGAAGREHDDTTRLLERLEAEERARRDARAHSEAATEADLARRQRELSEAQRRDEAAAANAERAYAEQRQAMREWHASFDAALGPLLAARGRLYRRIPHRMFARVRPQCDDVARAVEEAAARYRSAPEPHVEALARNLLAVYRDSAQFCVGGAYFSFSVEERNVRELVGGLIKALAPYGLAFPQPVALPPVPRPPPASHGPPTPDAGGIGIPALRREHSRPRGRMFAIARPDGDTHRPSSDARRPSAPRTAWRSSPTTATASACCRAGASRTRSSTPCCAARRRGRRRASSASPSDAASISIGGLPGAFRFRRSAFDLTPQESFHARVLADQVERAAEVEVIPVALTSASRPAAGEMFTYTAELRMRRRAHEMIAVLHDPATGALMSSVLRVAAGALVGSVIQGFLSIGRGSIGGVGVGTGVGRASWNFRSTRRWLPWTSRASTTTVPDVIDGDFGTHPPAEEQDSLTRSISHTSASTSTAREERSCPG